MKTAAMTTMMAGPRTVGLGCFSPMQQLDKRSEATLQFISCIFAVKTLKNICQKVPTEQSLFSQSSHINHSSCYNKLE